MVIIAIVHACGRTKESEVGIYHDRRWQKMGREIAEFTNLYVALRVVSSPLSLLLSKNAACTIR